MLPHSASVEHMLPAVLDQGALGSCVAHGVVQALYCAHRRQGIPLPELASRAFVWYLARAKEHQQWFNAGCTIRDAFESLNEYGFCPERELAYINQTFGDPPPYARMPPWSAFQAAFDQRRQFGPNQPAIYTRLDSDGLQLLEDIKVAICNQHPVVFGANVSRSFTRNDFDPTDAIEPPREDMAGGHCMLVFGYVGDVFLVRNSWGEEFGYHGSCRFTADYMLATQDRWIVDHAPEFRGE